MRLLPISLVFLASLPVMPAFADGFSLLGGTGLFLASGGDRGMRNDLNAYLEANYANFYFGASTDFYNDRTENEVDLSLGYRNTTASDLSYDISYTRDYLPNASGEDYGDVALSLSIPMTPVLTGTFDGDYYPESKLSEAHLTVGYALNDKVTLEAVYGGYENDGAPTTKEWELAAAYAVGNETAVKVHYYKGSDYKGYVGLDLTWDATLLGG
ncbi:MAG: hypothetical protein ACOH2H_16565 [Cypionkella sp.]